MVPWLPLFDTTPQSLIHALLSSTSQQPAKMSRHRNVRNLDEDDYDDYYDDNDDDNAYCLQ
jgi:hypothetical protein